ncbi:MAG: hypothetical protein ACLFQM_04870 [Fidelibacterota bacterium]
MEKSMVATTQNDENPSDFSLETSIDYAADYASALFFFIAIFN